ncbi:hypothetical protein [Terrabacter sp. Soil810]|uniref:hypothetical protein n=1 Tax=Terrabacter sp. Soil810 TaxID=1736418 RepID=UPI00070A1D08|nr:hypothetical protein [Terrabacter sp. Soil810]KRF40079.1 hypothetical protein ASG96_03905 [Terrabacter sp. Soil810]
MRNLLVEDADHDAVSLTLSSEDAVFTGVAAIPRLDLLRTGTAELLVKGEDAELDQRAGRYASLLIGVMERALGPDVQLTNGELEVEVRCTAAVQSLIWETLRLSGDEAESIRVFRTLPGLAPTARPTEGGDLVWLAARKVEDKIARYGVAGPVLAELRITGAIMPRWVSTASTPQLIRALPRRVPPDPALARIVHLDVHGGTVARPDDNLVRADFVAQFGPETMDDQELEGILGDLGCRVFVSNACHSGDLRDAQRLPFPARLLSRGTSVALVARGPVPELSAIHFHRHLYAALSVGASVLDAHAQATARSAEEWQEDRDRRARGLIQPMLWARSISSATEPVCAPATNGLPEDLPGLRNHLIATAQLFAAAEGGVLASAMIAAEGELAAGRPMPRLVFTDAELSRQSAATMGNTIRWALGTSPDAPTTSGMEIPPLQFEERRAMLQQLFGSKSSLLDVLAVCSAGDPVHLAAAAMASEWDPFRALLRAGELGQMTGDVSQDDPGVQLAHKVLEPFPNDPVIRATLAVPLLGVGTDAELAGAWIPPAPKAWIDHVAVPDARISIVRHAGHHFMKPDRSVRDAARALSSPKALASLRLSPAWRGPELKMARQQWDVACAEAAATMLVLSVAARQAQGIDIVALTHLLGLIGNTGYGDAARLAEAMRKGLPGWPPVHPDLSSAWDGIVADWSELNGVGESLLESARADEGLDGRTRQRKHAYQLARGDDPASALVIAVTMLATASLHNRFDYCECLHLLGEAQERLGRVRLAAEMLLKERAIDPPADHRRLHNRDHLYELVFGLEPRDDDLLFTVAMEGVAIATRCHDGQARTRFLTRALVCGLNASQDGWLRKVVDDLRAEDTVDSSLLDLVHGYLHIDADKKAAVAALMAAATAQGTYAAHASLLLSVVDPEGAEAHLWRGARTDGGGSYQTLCLDTLVMQLMQAGRENELRTAVSTVSRVPRDRPPIWYARAGLAYLDEDPTFGRLLVEALTTDGGRRLSLLTGLGIPPTALPLQAAIDAIGELVHMVVNPGDGGVAPLAAADNIARLARKLDPPNRRWAVARLLGASEQTWDQQNFAVAAGLRSHACDLLAELGEPEDLAALAEEMGWLATLNRIRGRPTDAEGLFQTAIALARKHLPPFGIASLISRYGNLLHDIGESAAAAHLHWTAVQTALPNLATEAFPTPEILEVVFNAVAAVDPESPERGRWDIMLVNLANTLTDSGQPTPAAAIINWMVLQIQAGHNASAETRMLLVGVTRRLAGR